MIDTSISDSDKNLEDPNLYGRMGIELQDKSGRPLATAIEHVSVGKSDFAGFYGVYSETVEKLNKTTFKSNDGTSVIIKYTTAGQVSEAVFLGESVKLAEEDGAK